MCWCSFRRQLPEGSGGFHVGSRGNFRNVPEGSSVCWCRFRRQLPEGSGGFRRVVDIVHMGKTIAEQECAHVVKHGKRLLLLGIPPKLIEFCIVMGY